MIISITAIRSNLKKKGDYNNNEYINLAFQSKVLYARIITVYNLKFADFGRKYSRIDRALALG